MADVLWKIGHQQIPTGNKVLSVAIDSANCPWCPDTVNSIAHLFHDCPTAAMIWAQIIQVASLVIDSLTPISDLIHHPSLSHQRIGRILQSVAIYSKWIVYSTRAFSSPTPPPMSRQEIADVVLRFVLDQRNIDKQLHKSPWPPPSSIIHIFN